MCGTAWLGKLLAICVIGVAAYTFYFMQFGGQLVYFVDDTPSYSLKNKGSLIHLTVIQRQEILGNFRHENKYNCRKSFGQIFFSSHA